jgi:hypothetical protein
MKSVPEVLHGLIRDLQRTHDQLGKDIKEIHSSPGEKRGIGALLAAELMLARHLESLMFAASTTGDRVQ